MWPSRKAVPKPYVKASPNPVPARDEGRTTISWDMGDGSNGVVVLVVRHLDGTKLAGMIGGPSGAKQIDWIDPETRYLFHLYRRDDWDERETRTPQPLAQVEVMRHEVALEARYDIAVVALAISWVIGAAALFLALVFVAMRWLERTRTNT
jgi:hypothetical protein